MSSTASVARITPSLGTVSPSGPAPLCGTLQSSCVPFLQNALIIGTHTHTHTEVSSISVWVDMKCYLYFSENVGITYYKVRLKLKVSVSLCQYGLTFANL